MVSERCEPIEEDDFLEEKEYILGKFENIRPSQYSPESEIDFQNIGYNQDGWLVLLDYGEMESFE